MSTNRIRKLTVDSPERATINQILMAHRLNQDRELAYQRRLNRLLKDILDESWPEKRF